MDTLPIIIPEIKIEENEGFKKNDIFKFEEFGGVLANLVLGCGGNITIGLEDEWGNGKTTFIKMWQGYIRNHPKNPMESIYFDAFVNDYQKDPFLALVSQIYGLVKDKSIKNKLKKQTKNITLATAKGSLKLGVNMGLNYLTAGLLNTETVSKASGKIDNLFFAKLKEGVDQFVDDKLKNIKNNDNLIKEFKENLEKWTEKQKNPVVFIIDELDRCRPDFALELIERIKHFFSIKGLVFFLVVNKKQLENSIKHKYGIEYPSTYLQKFIHLWLKLPKISEKTESITQYIKYIFHRKDILHNIPFGTHILNALAINFQLTFRDINKIYTYLTFIIILLNKEKMKLFDRNDFNNFETAMMIFVCYAKVCKSEFLENIVNNYNREVFLKEISECKSIDVKDFFRGKELTLYDLIFYDVSKNDRSEIESNKNFSHEYTCVTDSLIELYYYWIHKFPLDNFSKK